MKKQLTFLLLTLTITVFGQVQQKKNPTDFIPKGYVIHKYEGGIFSGSWNEITGDLNNDGLEDMVLIIKGLTKIKS